MPNKITVSFESHANEIRKAKDEAIERALEIIGLQAEKYAKLEAPVDTGRLRNSISHDADSDSAYVGTNVEYAPYQEFGTRRQTGHPFLRPSIENHVSEYKSILEQELKGE